MVYSRFSKFFAEELHAWNNGVAEHCRRRRTKRQFNELVWLSVIRFAPADYAQRVPFKYFV